RAVRARVFRANEITSRWVQVHYAEAPRSPQHNRYVMASTNLMGARLQPYIHDCVVKIGHRRRQFTFRIFYKRHKFLPVNQAIQALAGVAIEGDVLIVACGKKVAVRNMQNRLEARAAEQAVKRFAQGLGPFRTRRSFPALLEV
ncbi:hypothetical protein DFJ43DRAFT_990276, partial [Lentinula guzmanii]